MSECNDCQYYKRVFFLLKLSILLTFTCSLFIFMYSEQIQQRVCSSTIKSDKTINDFKFKNPYTLIDDVYNVPAYYVYELSRIQCNLLNIIEDMKTLMITTLIYSEQYTRWQLQSLFV